MSYDDTEIYDTPCPKCGNEVTKVSPCTALCEDGWFDESDEDYCIEGTIMVPCNECLGTGRLQWCPACGYNLQPGERTDVQYDDSF